MRMMGEGARDNLGPVWAAILKQPINYRRFEYPRGRLPNARLAALEEGVQNIEQARAKSGASVGYPGWPLIYYLVLCSVDPARKPIVVETGTNHGCSTIALGQALVDNCGGGMVHTIEIDPTVAAIAEDNLRAAGLDHVVTLHIGAAEEVLPGLLPRLPEIDLAFLDGSHLYADVLLEFEAVVAKLCRGGLVIFDNTYPIAEAGEDPRVNGALKEIRRRFGGSLLDLPFVSWYTPGVAIWQREATSLGKLS